jgi:hypothetical protein
MILNMKKSNLKHSSPKKKWIEQWEKTTIRAKNSQMDFKDFIKDELKKLQETIKISEEHASIVETQVVQ